MLYKFIPSVPYPEKKPFPKLEASSSDSRGEFSTSCSIEASSQLRVQTELALANNSFRLVSSSRIA